MTNRVCGNCESFVRIKSFNRGRSGLCDALDYSVHVDGKYAKKCQYFSGKKYKRVRLVEVTNE